MTQGTSRRRQPAHSPAQAAAAGFWTQKVEPFLGRYSAVLSIVLVMVATVRIVSTYSELSLTFDEGGHFACGLEYLQKHVYLYEAQHPPLSRAAMALLPYLNGARLVGGPNRDSEGPDVIERSGNSDRTIFLMRLGILPFFWVACWVVYAWARKFWSRAIAALAMLCFTLIPTVLAHAGLATTDMALTATLPAAFFALLLWCDSPTWPHAILFGAASALAALSKFTSLGYLPASALAALVLWCLQARPSPAKLWSLAQKRLPGFGLAVLAGAFLVWAGYWFSFGTGDLKLPAWEFFKGIGDALGHNTGGHGSASYLLGDLSRRGWWYFFPVALGIKTPLALLFLMIVGLAICCGRWRSTGEMSLLAFTIGVMAPAMTSPVNIGVRHVLPVYCSLSVMAALGIVGVAKWIGSPRAAGMFVGGLLLWTIISGALAHPDYIAYFNEIAASRPEHFLVDSDFDWGQGYKRASRLFQKMGVDHVAAKLNGPRYHPKLYPFPKMTEIDDFRPTDGWSVVGATDMKHISHTLNLQGLDFESIKRATQYRDAWFDAMEPTMRVDGLLLFYFPPGTAKNWK